MRTWTTIATTHSGFTGHVGRLMTGVLMLFFAKNAVTPVAPPGFGAAATQPPSDAHEPTAMHAWALLALSRSSSIPLTPAIRSALPSQPCMTEPS